MKGRYVSGLLTAAVLLAGSSAVASARELSFEERVRAETAIERVHYSHLTGASKHPFEQYYTSELMARKVRTYLAESAALESIWKTPVTAEMLQKELERMARQTKMPERLQELYQALGNDSFLIQECLARPALVDRLARSFFAGDPTLHAEQRRRAEQLHDLLKTGRLDPWTEHPDRTEFHLVRVEGSQGRGASPTDEARSDEKRGRTHVDLQPEEFARWDALLPDKAGQIGALVEEREAFVVRATLERRPGEVRTASYAIKKRDWDPWWQSVEGTLNPLAVAPVASDKLALPRPLASPTSRFDPSLATSSSSIALASSVSTTSAPAALADDTWDNGSLYAVPDPRYHHTGIWTGNVMVIWGGFNSGAYLDTGARYDPATDTWSPTTQVGAPTPRGLHTAVFDGFFMIIWGGYFPRTINAANGELVRNFSPLGDGMFYFVDLDLWLPLDSFSGEPPSPRYGHMAAWNGSQMLIWGGYGLTKDDPQTKAEAEATQYLGTGAMYDENLSGWVTLTTTDAPLPRWQGVAVWADDRFIVWGGFGVAAYLDPPLNKVPALDVLRSGGMYDPLTDSWTATNLTGAPTGRQEFSGVWAGGGGRMVIWGGIGRNPADGHPSYTLSDGALFNPTANSWSVVASAGAPDRRFLQSTVWTGSEMLVWGGYDGISGIYLNSGGRYNPASNSWSNLSSTGAPSPRYRASAVWTGTQMIIWGGSFNGASLDSGGRYTLATDSWTATSRGSGPIARAGHTSIWTGSEMIVWGGRDRMLGLDYNSGSSYDPVTDQWTPISATGAPAARSGQSGIWVDSGKMLIWGGVSIGAVGSTPVYINTGGRYDPVADSWSPMSTTNAPSGRSLHSTIWTGTEMIVWGGGNPTILNTGGRYDPAQDRWVATAIPADAVLASRAQAAAVWTGTEMIVWGGIRSSAVDTGALYNPSTDTWRPVSTVGAPEKRYLHAAVWTGSTMLVWGGWEAVTDAFGNENSNAARDGGRYDPVTDTWQPTSLFNAPPGAVAPGYTWTGNRFMVWGGASGLNGPYRATGGIYDPGTDGWTAISQVNAPSPRNPGNVLWTGDLLLVWGGFNGAPMSSGGRYSSLSGSSLSTFFLDVDGDGVGDPTQAAEAYSAPAGYVAAAAADCNDADWTAWSTPSEVPGLTFTDPMALTWATPSNPGAISVNYDVLRSTTPTDFLNAAICVTAGRLITSAIDEETPAVGQVFYYLARAQNSCPNGTGVGPLGFDASGAPRQGRSCQ